jgi:hypothetical protein
MKNSSGEVITLGNTLKLDRCPYCSIAKPTLNRLHFLVTANDRRQNPRDWNLYVCTACGGCVVACATANNPVVLDYFPKNETVSDDIPERARNYLTQAIASLHSPSGCIMLCASSVDAMLKVKGYREGSLNSRINQARDQHLITADMADWFHHVRIEANEERHDDEETSMPTTQEAQKSIDFVKALGEFMFVLPARIAEGVRNTPPNP